MLADSSADVQSLQQTNAIIKMSFSEDGKRETERDD